MRLAFFLLLFVNAAFLIWHQLHQPSNEPVAAAAKSASNGTKSIRLLHEMENGNRGAPEVAEPVSTPTPRPRESPRASIEDSPRVNAPPASSTATESPPPLTELEKKVLAAEARQAERIEANLAARRNEERSAREHPQPSAEPRATVCFSLGPFKVQDQADAALAKLAKLVLRATFREQEIHSAQQWWVIEATKDERAAQKRLDELHKKKVADASIINNGEYENMISLGVYASEALANKRVNALVKLGFRPVVEKHFDSITHYWIDVDEAGPRSVLTAAQLKDAIGGAQGVEKQKRACK